MIIHAYTIKQGSLHLGRLVMCVLRASPDSSASLASSWAASNSSRLAMAEDLHVDEGSNYGLVHQQRSF
jgi:hypothetical protein